MRAAYIHEGLHQFCFYSQERQPHRSQDYQSTKFMNNIDLLMETAYYQKDSLLTNPKFIKLYDPFREKSNGKGDFQKIITGKEYAAFKLSLNNPKRQLNLVGIFFNITKYK